MSQECTCADGMMSVIGCSVHGSINPINIEDCRPNPLATKNQCGCLVLYLGQGRAVLFCKEQDKKLEEFLK